MAKSSVIASFRKLIGKTEPVVVEVAAEPVEQTVLGEHEMSAIAREAFEAYDFQEERVRFDTKGRKWVFEVEVIPPGHAVLRLSVSRLDDARTTTIPTSTLGCDAGQPACYAAVSAMSEAMG